MEKISVIIPTYNRANILEKALTSVLKQTYDNLEVIIVDDGSTDHTEELIRQIKDARICYVKQTVNGGAAAARNVGVMQATAELIAFQDSDDCWHLDKLEKQMKYWKEHPNYSMIYSTYLWHGVNDKLILVPNSNEGIWGELEGDIFSSLLIRNSIGTPTVLMRKVDFLEVGGFDTQLKCLEDWDFVLRFARKHQIGYVQETLVDAYETINSVSSGVAEDYNTRCKMIAKYKKDLLDRDLFEQAVEDILVRAQNAELLEPVKKMLLLYLQQS